jgi:hypothetical protein
LPIDDDFDVDELDDVCFDLSAKLSWINLDSQTKHTLQVSFECWCSSLFSFFSDNWSPR